MQSKIAGDEHVEVRHRDVNWVRISRCRSFLASTDRRRARGGLRSLGATLLNGLPSGHFARLPRQARIPKRARPDADCIDADAATTTIFWRGNRGDTIPNLVLAKPDSNGRICIYTQATAHLVADVAGSFPTGSNDNPVTNATRILDTREGTGFDA